MIYELVALENKILDEASVDDVDKLDYYFNILSSSDENIVRNEWIELYDHLGKRTGQIKLRDLVYRDGDWHKSVHYNEFRVESGSAYILFQKRGASVDVRPGVLDAVAAGHYSVGEGEVAAIREIQEELGKKLKLKDLIPMGTRKFVDQYGTIKKREFQDVYFRRDDESVLTSYQLQYPEVDSIYKVPVEPLIELLTGSKNIISQVDFFTNSSSGSCSISANDFWPNLDNYFLKSALIVNKLLEAELIPENPFLLDLVNLR